MTKDLNKETLYQSVKTLVECEDKHIHLDQQKLFTLFSIAFQYMVYRSTKRPGHYIIRTEDSYLAEKLARKSKDFNTRKFMSRMLIPRRLKFNNSIFHLDYFQPSTWNITSELPQHKIQGAVIVKNTSSQTPMSPQAIDEDEQEVNSTQEGLDKNFSINILTSTLPQTVTIAFEENIDGLQKIRFPFIQKQSDLAIKGVKLAKDLDLDL